MLSKSWIGLGALVLALSACSVPSTPNAPDVPRSRAVSNLTDLFETPTSSQVTIAGAANMNGGAPARVKVYYLNSPDVFQSADFFAVFGDPEQTLGADLIEVEEFQLAPGRSVNSAKSFDVPPAAIGVVAAFRDIDGQFLAVKPIIPGAPNPVAVTLRGNTVTIR